MTSSAGLGGAELRIICGPTAAGKSAIALALAERRESLARLRGEPRCALTIVAEGISITAHGRATVAPLEEALAAVRITVDAIQDHADPRFAIDEGVRWRWTDTQAGERDAAVRAALRALAP